MKSYKDIKDNTYCFYAFHSLSSHNTGKSRPCCVSSNKKTRTWPTGVDIDSYTFIKKNKVAKNVEEYINDPEIKKVRKSLLKGNKPESCKGCWDREDAGIKSFRQIQNEIYQSQIDKSLKNIQQDGYLKQEAVKYLDITLGNVCNLKCRSCNPSASHHWIKESSHVPHTGWDKKSIQSAQFMAENPWHIKAFENNFFDPVLPNVETINFLGGEPLAVREHYDWLQHIINNGWAKNISLHYNTNATIFPKKLLDIWDNFKSVNLSLSLDAIGDLAYYVRYPSKWKLIEKNIERLKEYTKYRQNITIHVHTTVSILNVLDLDKMIYWCRDQYKDWHFFSNETWNNWGFHNLIPHFNIVDEPEWLHVRHLPLEMKKLAEENILSVYRWISNNEKIPQWEEGKLEDFKNLINLIQQERSEK
jgi:MoaA/NifB/PqqE/SkfB family radical SAM enzyme